MHIRNEYHDLCYKIYRISSFSYKTIFSCLVELPGNIKTQEYNIGKKNNTYTDLGKLWWECCGVFLFIYIIIYYSILRSSHSSCQYKRPNQSNYCKAMEYLSSFLFSAYSSFSFPDKDFQFSKMLFWQFELVMNTTNPLNTRNSNKLKNQDLMASLQIHPDWTE